MSEIVIYKAKDGHVELNVNLRDETVWLSLNQITDLFGRDKSVISRHIKQILKNEELDENQTVANFATVQKEGSKDVRREIDYYNLDMIISVGYRVNSRQGVEFRQWASSVLKNYLIQGYALKEQRLAERGIKELQQSIELLQKTLIQNELVNDIGSETIQLIMSYAKTWDLLLAYDEDQLTLPQSKTVETLELGYLDSQKAIAALKNNLMSKKQATDFFGRERQGGLQSILGNIEQTFDGEPLYKTIEEKAANLIYFIIKDHPFIDGNKRIGSFFFLLYLRRQGKPLKLNENGLTALALLIAESEPSQKDLMIRLIVNLLLD